MSQTDITTVSSIETQILQQTGGIDSQFAQYLIDSKVLPKAYDTPAKVIVGIQTAKELGLPPITGLKSLPMISGIPSPTVHLLVSLARKAGIKFTLVDDFKTIFEPVLNNDGTEKLDENNKPVLKKDIITTIRCSEYKEGRWFDSDISFRWGEAVSAQLTTKDNWSKYPRVMLRSRALSLAARFSAPEATCGLLTDAEQAEISNVPYVVEDINV